MIVVNVQFYSNVKHSNGVKHIDFDRALMLILFNWNQQLSTINVQVVLMQERCAIMVNVNATGDDPVHNVNIQVC